MDKTWPKLNDVVSMDLDNWHFRNSSHYAVTLNKVKYKDNNQNPIHSAKVKQVHQN